MRKILLVFICLFFTSGLALAEHGKKTLLSYGKDIVKEALN